MKTTVTTGGVEVRVAAGEQSRAAIHLRSGQVIVKKETA